VGLCDDPQRERTAAGKDTVIVSTVSLQKLPLGHVTTLALDVGLTQGRWGTPSGHTKYRAVGGGWILGQIDLAKEGAFCRSISFARFYCDAEKGPAHGPSDGAGVLTAACTGISRYDRRGARVFAITVFRW